MTRSRIHIGTSGWSYNHWKGSFYPEDLPDKGRLEYYAKHFKSVEINNSFYHLPGKKTLRQWRDAVPADFVFTAKASRYITHMKKLKDPGESVPTILERISVLEDNSIYCHPSLKFLNDSLLGCLGRQCNHQEMRHEADNHSVIKADIGSIGGHICPSQRLLDSVTSHVQKHGKGLPSR